METIPQSPIDNPEQESLETTQKSSTYPTLVDLLSIFGLFILSQVILSLLVIFVIEWQYPDLTAAEQLPYVTLITQIISMSSVIIFISILRRKRGAAPIKLHFGLKGFDPAILLAGVVMLTCTTLALEPLLSLMPPPPSLGSTSWPLLLSVVVGAPLFEEIICRGLIFESLRLRSGLVVAWVGSSLFFGLMHLHPTMVVNAFFMGLILCYFYIRSRSLAAPIILHAINNALAYTCILLGFDQNATMREMISSDTIYWIAYAISVVILIAATIVCTRKQPIND